MLIKYIIFCIGAAYIQIAYAMQPNMHSRVSEVLHSPVWFLSKSARIIVPVLAMGLFIIELVWGLYFTAWWAGFIWIGAILVASLTPFLNKNTGSPFYIGVVILIGVLLWSLW